MRFAVDVLDTTMEHGCVHMWMYNHLKQASLVFFLKNPPEFLDTSDRNWEPPHVAAIGV